MNKIVFVDLRKENDLIRKSYLKKLNRVIDRSDFSFGRELKEFEDNFAKFCGAKFCIGVASGTDALRTALLACGIKEGDEVITTPISYTATSLAVAHVNAKPVFVDALEDGNIDPSKIKKAISKKTKAILIVHIYGNPCDLDKIKRIAKKHKLFLIDDCAHAHGATYKNKRIGSLVDISCFSFYPTKNLGAWGDGGAITTNNKGLYEKAKLYKGFGGVNKDFSKVIGYNSKLDTIQAAVLNEKLKNLPKMNKKRSALARRYTQALKGVGDIKALTFSKDCSYYVFPIKTNQREKLKEFLSKKGIQTLIHYPLPIHLQECFKYLGYKKGDFPNAEKHTKTVMSLPFYPFLNTKEQDRIINSIKDFFNF